jgi:hypothetical protein
MTEANTCNKPCDHGSPCLLLKGHEPVDRHDTQHGCVFYDAAAVANGRAGDDGTAQMNAEYPSDGAEWTQSDDGFNQWSFDCGEYHLYVDLDIEGVYTVSASELTADEQFDITADEISDWRFTTLAAAQEAIVEWLNDYLHDREVAIIRAFKLLGVRG